MRKRVLWLIVLIITIGFSSNTYAFFETYGAGSRARAMGGAFTAIADDFSAPFYNPAGLAQNTGNRFTVEYIYCLPDLGVKNENGEKFVAMDEAGHVLYEPVNGFSGTPDIGAPIIGLEMDVNEIVKSVFNLPFNTQLALLAGIPNNGTKAWEMVPDHPDIPHFLSFGDVTNHFNVHIAAGVELMEGFFYLGGGGTVNMAANADMISPEANISTYRPTILHGVLAADVGIDFQAGVLFTPFEKKVRLGAAWKETSYLDISTLQLLAQVPLGGTLFSVPLETDYIISYRPQEFDFGLAVVLDQLPLTDMLPLPFKSLTVSMDVIYKKWSDYDYSDTYKYQLDLANNPQLIADTIKPMDFDDTVEIKLGMIYEMNENISGMIGYQQLKTPIPEQSQRISNYIDMDRNVYSIGGTYKLTDLPFSVSGAITYSSFDGYFVNNEGVVGLAWGGDPSPDAEQESFEVSDGSSFTISMGVAFSF